MLSAAVSTFTRPRPISCRDFLRNMSGKTTKICKQARSRLHLFATHRSRSYVIFRFVVSPRQKCPHDFSFQVKDMFSATPRCYHAVFAVIKLCFFCQINTLESQLSVESQKFCDPLTICVFSCICYCVRVQRFVIAL